MTASRHLQRYWRAASDAQIAWGLRQARASVLAFGTVTAQSGSLIQSWIAGQSMSAFAHYPVDDLVDLRHGSQFYYHAHRNGEQGHLHLFWHATAAGNRRYFKPGQVRWRRTAPTHLLAIALDARGLPTGLFTVNQWVTDGLVDDNYLGRLEAFTGRVREAGLPLGLRTQIEGRRHARQDNYGPPSAQIQATPKQVQSSSFCRQGRYQREKRPAY